MHTTTFASPLGPLQPGRLGRRTDPLHAARHPADRPRPTSRARRAWLELARRELDAYFAGELREFTVPVDLSRVGPPHRRILDALSGVGYGRTTTYGALATELGLVDDGPRTVGGAMARNPV